MCEQFIFGGDTFHFLKTKIYVYKDGNASQLVSFEEEHIIVLDIDFALLSDNLARIILHDLVFIFDADYIVLVLAESRILLILILLVALKFSCWGVVED